jgi:hypothetical protein
MYITIILGGSYSNWGLEKIFFTFSYIVLSIEKKEKRYGIIFSDYKLVVD